MVNIRLHHIKAALLLLLILYSCRTERFPYDKSILLIKKNYSGLYNRIINGVYLEEFGNDDLERQIYFPDGYFYNDVISKDSIIKSCNVNNSARFIPYFWGIYCFRNDTLIVNRVWGGRDKFQMFKSEELRAKVLNDSTLLFFSRKNIFNQVLTTQDTFCFRRCTEVPSSFNILMKDE